VALTRMISAVFRRGGDVAFVAEELKAVFDPEGGRWMEGRYVPSLLAAIGDVIEAHMIRTGFLVSEAGNGIPEDAQKRALAPLANRQEEDTIQGMRDAKSGEEATRARFCPRCGNRSLHRIEGCWTCTDCQYSHCG